MDTGERRTDNRKLPNDIKVSLYPNEAHIRPNPLRQSLVRFLAQGPTIPTKFLLRFFSPFENFHTNWGVQ